ncbi:MAG TPA: hypothetical protein VIN05_03610 [Roseovarius sp.]
MNALRTRGLGFHVIKALLHRFESLDLGFGGVIGRDCCDSSRDHLFDFFGVHSHFLLGFGVIGFEGRDLRARMTGDSDNRFFMQIGSGDCPALRIACGFRGDKANGQAGHCLVADHGADLSGALQVIHQQAALDDQAGVGFRDGFPDADNLALVVLEKHGQRGRGDDRALGEHVADAIRRGVIPRDAFNRALVCDGQCRLDFDAFAHAAASSVSVSPPQRESRMSIASG